MKDNKIAKTLRIIGYVEAICGIIIGLIIASNGDELIVLGIALAITSFVTCMLLLGFSEIILLLEDNVNAQEKMIGLLINNTIEKNNTPKTELQDIEDNLPEL